MERLFNNRIIDGISKIADVLIIGFYCLVCCLPIFTIGASLTALYYAINKCVFQGKGYTTEFFHSFKDNFKQSTLSWLIFLVVIGVLSGDIYITKYAIPEGSNLAFAPILFTILLVLTILWAVFHFAYVARFENTFKESFKISAIIMLANIPMAIVILVEIGVFVLLIYRFYFMLLLSPGLIACAIQPVMEKIFKKYMSPEDLEEQS